MGAVQVNAHAWVERDGKVIDPWFSEYDLVCQKKNCKNQRKYQAAPADVQKRLKAMLDEEIKDAKATWIAPLYGSSYLNAVMEAERNGGVVVLGSMGFILARLKKIPWWEYGNPKFTTYDDFVKTKNF